MKGALSTLTILGVVLIIFVSISFGVKPVHAQNTNYAINNVKYTTTVLYNGYVLINNTLTLNATGAPEILIGFPYEYGSDVIRGIVYSGSEMFPVTLNVPLDNHVGYYGAKVTFPNGAPKTFNTMFLLSNNLLSQSSVNATLFTLNFPTFPSLTETAATCNASVSLPQGAIYSKGTIPGFTYSTTNLNAFNYSLGNVTFIIPNNEIQKFAIRQTNRQVTVGQFGNINGVDTYSIVSMVASPFNISSVEVNVPFNATGISATDEFGRPLSTPTLTDNKTNTYRVTFIDALATNISLKFSVSYGLPTAVYEPVQSGISSYDLNLTVFQNINGYAETASAVFTLPEGAKVTSLENVYSSGNYAVSKNVFQESVVITKANVFSFDSMMIGVGYDYNPLWVSFRPTLWMWVVTLCGLAVVLVWQRPKTLAPVVRPKLAAQVGPDFLRSVVDSYEEKMKILREIDSLEARAEKGKIPRRRYKVQRKTLETRLETLSRDLTEYTEQMKSSGGQYSDLMLQLEVAESEIKEVGANIKAAEAMHNRGELSLEAYRKRLADYQRRKENAETAMNGILLRLREEIR